MSYKVIDCDVDNDAVENAKNHLEDLELHREAFTDLYEVLKKLSDKKIKAIFVMMVGISRNIVTFKLPKDSTIDFFEREVEKILEGSFTRMRGATILDSKLFDLGDIAPENVVIRARLFYVGAETDDKL